MSAAGVRVKLIFSLCESNEMQAVNKRYYKTGRSVRTRQKLVRRRTYKYTPDGVREASRRGLARAGILYHFE